MISQALPLLCAAFTGLFYYLFIFTEWGNFFHGGGPVDKALLGAVTVIAAYLCLEVVRSRQAVWVRVAAGFFGMPPALATIASLWAAYSTVFGQ